MVGWLHRLNGYEFEQAQEMKDGEAWRVAVHGFAESDMTKQLNNNMQGTTGVYYCHHTSE